MTLFEKQQSRGRQLDTPIRYIRTIYASLLYLLYTTVQVGRILLTASSTDELIDKCSDHRVAYKDSSFSLQLL